MAMTVNGTPIGLCLYPLEWDVVDYSRFDRDEFGEITVIKRGYSDTQTYVVEVPAEEAAVVKAFLTSLRSTEATYVGDPDVPFSEKTGFLRSLKFSLIDWKHVEATLVVETPVATEEPQP